MAGEVCEDGFVSAVKPSLIRRGERHIASNARKAEFVMPRQVELASNHFSGHLTSLQLVEGNS